MSVTFSLPLQLPRPQINQNSFWVHANEEAFESNELFNDLESTFGIGKGKLQVLICMI